MANILLRWGILDVEYQIHVQCPLRMTPGNRQTWTISFQLSPASIFDNIAITTESLFHKGFVENHLVK